MHVGERIRAVRELRRLSLGQLSKLSSVPKASISLWEKEDRNIGYKKLEALADVLRIPLSVLLDHPLWASKTPEYIVAKAALDSFIAQNDISPRDRWVLTEALENNEASYFEPEGWKQAYKLMKRGQRSGAYVAEFPRVADKAQSYEPPKKSRVSRQRKSSPK